jgi:hypothetical protein
VQSSPKTYKVGLVALILAAAGAVVSACARKPAELPAGHSDGGQASPAPAPPPPPVWAGLRVPGEGEALALHPDGPRVEPISEAQAAGLLVVDLSDAWAPFIFSESDGQEAPVKPNFYRQTFVDLANDRVDPEDLFLMGGPTRPIDFSPEAVAQRRKEQEERRKHKGAPPPPAPPRRKRTEPVRNYLEVFGIPPTLSVLLQRVEEDAEKSCYEEVDLEALRALDATVVYLHHKQARRDYDQAVADAGWVAARLVGLADAGAAETKAGAGAAEAEAEAEGGAETAEAGAAAGGDAGPAAAPGVNEAALEALASEPKLAARVERYRRGQRRLAAVRALQARLLCEGLLSPRSRFVQGMLDLPTHQALAAWERKNDIFGWGFLGGETLSTLQQPVRELHFETFKRVLAERMADAAGILEDGSASGLRRAASYTDVDGTVRPVPDLLGDYVAALLGQLRIASAKDTVRLLRDMGSEGLAHLHVAFTPPPLPSYYGAEMDLEVEIDRGDIWYEFPFDASGKHVEQRRDRFPSLTVFVRWNEQRIPLARWRTTIGSWRSELHRDGRVYYKYKNSDVGSRIWKYVVAAPVWVPPDGTPARDLLTKKVLDRQKGPVTVVNTEVMGPGFQSAYGLVMAIHHQANRRGGLFDNQIRTHGSVDYTSIARRFSHGCHRLVNTRAVRLFGFVLRRRPYERQGSNPLRIKKFFAVDGQKYGYELTTRGYYYELKKPVPVEVLEGRIMGNLKKPITAYVRKPGVDYGASGATEEEGSESPIETTPVVGP